MKEWMQQLDHQPDFSVLMHKVARKPYTHTATFWTARGLVSLKYLRISLDGKDFNCMTNKDLVFGFLL